MAVPEPSVLPAGRPASTRKRRAAWLTAALLVASAFAVLLPASPLYLPDVLAPKGVYEGRSVRSWLAQLDSADAEARLGAIFALGAIGLEAGEAVPALSSILLRDEDENARSQAALALAKMAPASRAAVPALAQALTDANLQVRMNSASALARLGAAARGAIPALLEGIEDGTNQTNLGKFYLTVQEMMVVALGRAGADTDEAVPALVAIVKGDGPDGLRAAAARGLGAVGEPARSSIPMLRGLLSDNSPEVRGSAQVALAKFGDRPEPQGRVAGPGRADLELPEAERAYLWQIENRGNELVKYGFGPLGKGLKEADGEALVSLLADDFEGTIPREPSITRLERGFAEVSRHRAAGPPARLTRAPFVARLLEIRKAFAAVPAVQFSLKTLRPVKRGRLDGAWEGTAQVRLSGEYEKGAPAEAVLVLSYRLSRLTREVLSRPGWLSGAGIEQITSAKASHLLFAEVARERGLDPGRLHDNWKSHKFAPVTGGVYVTDFDRDGILDVLITDLNGCTLYRGKRDGRFEDATAALGLPKGAPTSNAVAWVDIDGDGWDDLILGGRVFRNEGGKRFVDYSGRCNLRLPADVSGLIVADFDRDGRLDLYATRPALPGSNSWLDSRSADPLGNRLYRNKGGWRFEDVTKASGTGGDRRSTFTAAWLDANNDGWPDLHVVNEFGDGLLLVNNKDGTFRPSPLADRPADFGSMGLAVGDVDNDGNIDIYCANMFSKAGTRVIGNLAPDAYPKEVMRKMRRFVAGSQLHLNKGGLKFEQAGERMEVAGVGWAYGACLADLDNDGWLDIYATAGYLSRSRTEPDG